MLKKFAIIAAELFALFLVLSGTVVAQNQRDQTVVPDNTRFGARFKPEVRTTDRTFDPSGIGSIWFNRTTNKWRGNNTSTIVDLGSGGGGSSNIPTVACNSSTDKILWNNSTQLWECGTDLNTGGGGVGTVTSFSAGNLSPLFTSSVATASSTPALTFSLTNQNANTIFSGPATGSAAAPTFRALVAADIPSLSSIYQPLDTDLTTLGGLAKTDNNLIVANGTNWILTALSSCSNATTSKLLYNTTTRAFSCGTDQTGITSLNALTGPTQTFVNDTNVTVTSTGTTHTFGWAGTLAAARLNSNVVQAITNGTNITGSITAQNLTLGWTGTLAVAQGGTGSSSASAARTALGVGIGSDVQAFDADLTTLGGLAKTDNNLIVADGSTWILTQLPSCSNATTSKLLYNTTTRAFTCGTDETAGGGSGDFTDVNGTTNEIDSSTATGPATTLSLSPTLDLSTKVLQGGSPLVFEGASADAFETSLVVTDPTADRTFTLPNANSVAVQPDTGAANNFLTAISALGVVSKAQPNFTDLAGSATDAQVPDTITLTNITQITNRAISDTTGTLGVSRGGTNLTTATDDNIPVGNGTTWESKALPSCSNATTSKLLYDTATNTFSCGTDQNSGGGITASSTDTLTNKTIDAEATGNVVTIPFTLYIGAAGCNGATAGTIWDLPTSSPAVATCTLGTNTVQGYLAFADATSLSAQYNWFIPSDWSGNIDARIKWFSTATSGDVVWQLQTSCVADAETNDPSFNTANTVTDTVKGTTLQLNDASITTLTTTGCAAGELMHLKVLRDAAHASDTLAATANLIGIELKYRRAI